MTVSFDQIKMIELDFLNRIVLCIFHIIPRTHQKKLSQMIGLVLTLKPCKFEALLSLTYILLFLSKF